LFGFLKLPQILSNSLWSVAWFRTIDAIRETAALPIRERLASIFCWYVNDGKQLYILYEYVYVYALRIN